MIKLDDGLLQELGLAALPAEEKKKLLAHIYETLEMRVGMKLAEQMSDAQLTEFEQFIDRSDEAGALKWLETNFPNYKDVVAQEFERLKAEIREVAPQILAASSGSQQQVQTGIQPIDDASVVQVQQQGVAQASTWQSNSSHAQTPATPPGQQQYGQAPQMPPASNDPWGGDSQAAPPPPPPPPAF
jgi:hypothetical protein